MYKQYKLLNGNIANAVIRLEDGAFIPFDPDNMDFVEYQKWINDGNQPLPNDDLNA